MPAGVSVRDSTQRLHLVVLALDVMSYSLEFDQVQERMVSILTEVIQEALVESTTTPEPNVLPTGDGALIIFEGSSVASVVELAKAIQRTIDHRLLRLPLRMGVHAGQGIAVTDPAGRPNFVGSALNLAQRVMDLGDEGHLLLSQAAANELLQDSVHGGFTHRLNSNPVPVKHGVELEIYNYHSPDVGVSREPERARRSSEVTLAQLGRRAEWSDLFQVSSIVRAIDISMPILGTPALIDHLEEIVQRGESDLRILILDPTSAATYLRSTSSAYKATNELATTIEYVLKILQGLRFALSAYGPKALERFDVRLLPLMPSFSGVILDDRAYISLYVDHLSASRGPYFEVVRDQRIAERSLVACLTASFDSMWHRAPSLFAADLVAQLTAQRDAMKNELRNELPTYLGEMI